MSVRTVPLVLLLLVPILPAASAEFEVCAPEDVSCVWTDSESSGGDCQTGTHWESNEVEVWAQTPLGYTQVYAYDQCTRYGDETNNRRTLTNFARVAHTPEGGERTSVAFVWRDDRGRDAHGDWGECTVWTPTTLANVEKHPCPAGLGPLDLPALLP